MAPTITSTAMAMIGAVVVANSRQRFSGERMGFRSEFELRSGQASAIMGATNEPGGMDING
jgi:hypothetical protein